MKKLFLFVCSLSLFVGCGNLVQSPEPELSESTIIFADGTSVSKDLKIGQYINPISGDGNGVITYSSSNQSVASIDNNGKLTLLAEGQSLITASKEKTDAYKAVNKSYTITVTSTLQYTVTYENAVTWVNSIGTTWVQVIVELENTGSCPIYLSSGSYDLTNSSGSIVASKSYISEYPRVVAVGEKAYLYDETTLDNPVSGKLTVTPRFNEKKSTIENIRFNVSDVTLTDTTYYGVKAIGKIENKTSLTETATIYVVIVLLDSNNKPIGVLYDLISDDFPAQSSMGFEATSLSMPDSINKQSVANYITYAYPVRYQF